MNKTELVEAVVAKAGISKKDADAAVKATFEALESVWNEQGVYASSELRFSGDKT